MGCLSPNGNGREAYADALRNGASGVDRISLFDPEGLPVTIAGELKGFDPAAWIGAKDLVEALGVRCCLGSGLGACSSRRRRSSTA